MRFVGLVIALIGMAIAYFLGYRGMSIDQARTRLAQLLNLPGLAPPAAGAPTSAAQGGSGLAGAAAVAGAGVAGGGGGSW